MTFNINTFLTDFKPKVYYIIESKICNYERSSYMFSEIKLKAFLYAPKSRRFLMPGKSD